jgi:peroxiredoxin Q/BCP
MLKTGAKAPDFILKSDEEKFVSLRDFQGKSVFLFFFPKANTPG